MVIMSNDVEPPGVQYDEEDTDTKLFSHEHNATETLGNDLLPSDDNTTGHTHNTDAVEQDVSPSGERQCKYLLLSDDNPGHTHNTDAVEQDVSPSGE